jgi:hypothetical protein
MAERGCWVYAATDQYTGQDLNELTGVAGTAVRAAPAAGFTAVVSDVDLAEFGADALRRNLEDLDWLERTARAHHDVIDALSRVLPLLPMRLATVYSGPAAMAEAFAAREAELRDALARVRGRVEWGVKAYALAREDKPAGAQPAGAQPAGAQPASAARPASGNGPGTGAGLAYLRRRRDQLADRQDSLRDAVESARAVHGALARRAAQARLHAPQSPQLSGDRAPMLLNASYLLEEDAGAAFTSAVTTVAGEHPGLRIELTGPWPPYSFTGGDDE